MAAEGLDALVELMADLDHPERLTEEQLVAAAIAARTQKAAVETAVATELSRRGWSWRRIGPALGVDHSTAYGWVRDAGLLQGGVEDAGDQ